MRKEQERAQIRDHLFKKTGVEEQLGVNREMEQISHKEEMKTLNL